MNITASFMQTGRIAITAVLSLLPLTGLFQLMGGKLFFRTFTVVLSGRIFGDSWNRIHAGFSLDQPTIGKWYFWFTVFTVILLPYMGLVRRFCARRSKSRQWIFAVGLTILCLFLVCLLTIPFFWQIQYIDAMGITAKRVAGLFYGIVGYLVVLGFYVWAVHFKKTG
jgi:hypothetical protein